MDSGAHASIDAAEDSPFTSQPLRHPVVRDLSLEHPAPRRRKSQARGPFVRGPSHRLDTAETEPRIADGKLRVRTGIEI